MSGLTPAQVSMRDAPTEVQIRVRKRLVAHPFVRERSSCGCDSRARPKVSGQVLADESGHLQHVETRHGEDRLQRAVGLDDAALSYCTIINQADHY